MGLTCDDGYGCLIEKRGDPSATTLKDGLSCPPVEEDLLVLQKRFHHPLLEDADPVYPALRQRLEEIAGFLGLSEQGDLDFFEEAITILGFLSLAGWTRTEIETAFPFRSFQTLVEQAETRLQGKKVPYSSGEVDPISLRLFHLFLDGNLYIIPGLTPDTHITKFTGRAADRQLVRTRALGELSRMGRTLAFCRSSEYYIQCLDFCADGFERLTAEPLATIARIEKNMTQRPLVKAPVAYRRRRGIEKATIACRIYNSFALAYRARANQMRTALGLPTRDYPLFEQSPSPQSPVHKKGIRSSDVRYGPGDDFTR